MVLIKKRKIYNQRKKNLKLGLEKRIVLNVLLDKDRKTTGKNTIDHSTYKNIIPQNWIKYEYDEVNKFQNIANE